MRLEGIIQELVTNTCSVSLAKFCPELAVIGTIVALLLARICNLDKRFPGSMIALIGTVLALTLAAADFCRMYEQSDMQTIPLFTGLLVWDPFTAFFRVFLLMFLLFVVYLTTISGIPDNDDAPDFYVLLLGSTLGMLLMVSANNLLLVFLSVEMVSVPSYVMVGFLKGRKQSSEAALKYVVYGAGAAGVMLYGISLLAGLTGTVQLSEMTAALVQFMSAHHGFGDRAFVTLALALLCIFVGIAFKLSVVPFHFWCPDAFEGAAAEVAGFLSVASKAGAFGLLIRLCLTRTDAVTTSVSNAHLTTQLAELHLHLGLALGIIAALTATFGNLAAYAQTNVKRLLAYSTIAHAGYMLMAVAAMLVLMSGSESQALKIMSVSKCVEGLLYYLCVYFFMNLGAFAIVALIRNAIYSEEIKDYAGLSRQSPVLGVCMALCLFSLVGLPPLGGFFGKFVIFASLFDAGKILPAMWVILVIGGLNTVFSLFYYVRILKTMFIDSPLPDARPLDVPLASAAGRYVLLVSLPVLLLGIFVEPVSRIARDVARVLF